MNIKKRFCEADAGVITLWLIVAVIVILEAIALGFGIFVVYVVGLVLCASLLGIAFVVYNVVLFAQKRICS